MDGSDGQQRLEPADAFALLGNETRLAIVEELASREADPKFADLRRAVGVVDDGRFNYHLNRLRGHFVVQEDDRYRTTYAGEKVYEALVAGTFTEQVPEMSGAAGHDCPLCEERLSARYSDGGLGLRCERHGTVLWSTLPPKAAADRDLSELVSLVQAESRAMHERAAAGACPRCWASLPAPEYVVFGPDEWERLGGDVEPGESDAAGGRVGRPRTLLS